MNKFILFVFIAFRAVAASGQGRTATADVDGVTYKAILNGDQSISIKNGNKTIFRAKRGDLYISAERFANLTFEDFNGDGYKDLVIAYKSTVPGKRDLALYDKHTKKFMLVPEFPGFPEPARIPNSDYYFSYRPGGCAGEDWDSDLFRIVKYKIVQVATIAARGCQASGDKMGIFVYRIRGKKQEAYKILQLTELDKTNGDKKQFIEQYWTTQYKKFSN